MKALCPILLLLHLEPLQASPHKLRKYLNILDSTSSTVICSLDWKVKDLVGRMNWKFAAECKCLNSWSLIYNPQNSIKSLSTQQITIPCTFILPVKLLMILTLYTEEKHLASRVNHLGEHIASMTCPPWNAAWQCLVSALKTLSRFALQTACYS